MVKGGPFDQLGLDGCCAKDFCYGKVTNFSQNTEMNPSNVNKMDRVFKTCKIR